MVRPYQDAFLLLLKINEKKKKYFFSSNFFREASTRLSKGDFNAIQSTV